MVGFQQNEPIPDINNHTLDYGEPGHSIDGMVVMIYDTPISIECHISIWVELHHRELHS